MGDTNNDYHVDPQIDIEHLREVLEHQHEHSLKGEEEDE